MDLGSTETWSAGKAPSWLFQNPVGAGRGLGESPPSALFGCCTHLNVLRWLPRADYSARGPHCARPCVYKGAAAGTKSVVYWYSRGSGRPAPLAVSLQAVTDPKGGLEVASRSPFNQGCPKKWSSLRRKGGLVANRNRTAVLRWWGRAALVRWMKERGGLGGCWAARRGPATSPCSKPSAQADFGVVSCSFSKNGVCRGSAWPSLHPWSSASAPGDPSAHSTLSKAQGWGCGGVPEVLQVLPKVGSPHSLPRSPLRWVSTAGFLFAAQHSGT